MTEQEMRIAIAEACGWQDIAAYDDGKVIGLPPGFTEDMCPEGADEDVPDYPNDLNAMREAEEFLFADDHMAYPQWFGNLMNVCHGVKRSLDGYSGDWPSAAYLPARATARQRAEAFLRTIGKWKD